MSLIKYSWKDTQPQTLCVDKVLPDDLLELRQYEGNDGVSRISKFQNEFYEILISIIIAYNL